MRADLKETEFLINGKFLSQQTTGVQRFARELTLALDAICEPGEFAIAVPPDATDVPKYGNITVRSCRMLRGTLWEQISLPRLAAKNGAVTVNLCNASPLASPGVVCMHDAKIWSYPQGYRRAFVLWYRIMFRRAAGKAVRLITVSEHSRRELCRFCGLASERFTVVPDAWQHFERVEADENALTKYSLESGKYFFSLASLDPSKNFRWITDAAERHPDYIFASAGGGSSRVFSEKLGRALPPNIRLLGYVSDGEAKELMRRCRAFIFPSLEEGFGIPPLEALSVGAPCIVSSASCLPEIFGTSVRYIDPLDPSVDLDSLLAQPVSPAEDALGRYNWKTSAERLLALCREIVRE